METKRSDGKRGDTAVEKDKRWAEGWERGGEECHEPGGAAHAGGGDCRDRRCGFDYD